MATLRQECDAAARAAENAAQQQLDAEADRDHAREVRSDEIWRELWDGDTDLVCALEEGLDEVLAEAIRQAALRDQDLRGHLERVISDYSNEVAREEVCK